jgi:hypothetical protein
MYSTSSLGGPPANGCSSSCFVISRDILSTSLISDKSDALMNRQSEPGLVSRPYLRTVSEFGAGLSIGVGQGSSGVRADACRSSYERENERCAFGEYGDAIAYGLDVWHGAGIAADS